MDAMEQIIMDILAELRSGRAVDDRVLLKLSHAAARREHADKRMFAKRRLLPFYQSVKRNDQKRWEAWGVTPELEERLLAVRSQRLPTSPSVGAGTAARGFRRMRSSSRYLRRVRRRRSPKGPSPTTTHFGCCTATASRGVWPVAPRRPRSMSSSCGNAKTRAHVIVWWAERYELGLWRPYTEGELLDVLASDVAVTPPFCRISRMIRDFSSHDIVAGNKKPNLRQLVERSLRDMGSSDGVQEIRFREIGTNDIDLGDLVLDVVG